MTSLVEPSMEWEAAYRVFHEESMEAEEDFVGWWRPAERSFAEFVGMLKDHAEGKNLPDGWVPASSYWLVDNEKQILGEVNIRHELTNALEDFGGHIGYRVRPSRRGKGHGTTMLALALEKARALRLTRVLVTCDPANVASVRVIEKNGGILAGQSLAENGRMTARYWIDL